MISSEVHRTLSMCESKDFMLAFPMDSGSSPFWLESDFSIVSDFFFLANI